MANCYNCANEIEADKITAEHIPAQNLYTGYKEDYKKDRITVPACETCNHLYSKIDQEIRDAIAIKSDSKSEMVSKGFRSILRRSNWKERTEVNIDGKVVSVEFSYNDLRQIHLKNFKGIYFHTYNKVIPDNFVLEIIADGDENLKESAEFLYQYAMDGKEWIPSGHPDIFRYIIKPIAINDVEQKIVEPQNLEDAIGFVGVLIYHETILAIIVAGEEEYVKTCNPNT